MPAFCVRPNRSPLDQVRSISSVSGNAPEGPGPFVCTSIKSDGPEVGVLDSRSDVSLSDAEPSLVIQFTFLWVFGSREFSFMR